MLPWGNCRHLQACITKAKSSQWDLIGHSLEESRMQSNRFVGWLINILCFIKGSRGLSAFCRHIPTATNLEGLVYTCFKIVALDTLFFLKHSECQSKLLSLNKMVPLQSCSHIVFASKIITHVTSLVLQSVSKASIEVYDNAPLQHLKHLRGFYSDLALPWRYWRYEVSQDALGNQQANQKDGSCAYIL